MSVPPDAAPPVVRGARILVIDDDPLFLEVAVSTLSEHGFEVFAANSGAEGKRAINGARYSLVILDCGLSDPSELGILDIVQRLPEPCPVMILSVRDNAWHRKVMTLFGASRVIAKPISGPQLLDTVRRMLEV